MTSLQAGLAAAAERAVQRGLPHWQPEGQLLRPQVALLASGAAAPDARFWDGALAIQLAHEASLLHDDVIDQAATRRGAPTVQAAHGVAAALLAGDHLLTASYRLAAATGSPEFMEAFAYAVERTVRGEKLQAERRGQPLSWDEYCEVVEGKSGELFAVAAALPALLRRDAPAAREAAAAGRRLGRVYQMVDDLLDYCPETQTGKAPFADYRRRLWTWPLAELPTARFGLNPETVRTLFVTPRAPDGRRPIDAARQRLEDQAAQAASTWRAAVGGAGVEDLVEGWLRRAGGRLGTSPAWLDSVTGGRALDTAEDWMAYFARHGRTFRFASRLFPVAARRPVAGLYAFCRVTDDIADGGRVPPVERATRLDEWRALARTAYDGRPVGIPVLDEVLGASAAAGVPFDYAEGLIAGARMDLSPRTYATFDDLAVYTYHVAGVVGCWLTEWFGVHDADTLHQARAMGHAMQLTNIARDVGADLAVGRRYLPDTLLGDHGLTPGDLHAMHEGLHPRDDRWRDLMEALLREADRHYALAFPGLAALPRTLARPAAVAARAYQGIHQAIRRHDYDTLGRRATTGLWTKTRLGVSGLWDLAWLDGGPWPIRQVAHSA